MMADLRARLHRGAELISAASFALMFAAFMVQIVSRYIFDAPVSWSLEICSIGYIWIVFWTCDILVSERQHIIFDVLYVKFPPPWRRIVGIVNTATLGLIFLAALPTTLEYIHFLARRKTMILKLPFDIVYSCFAVFMIAVVIGAALRLRRLLGKSWQQHL
ncbi:MAG TPA: TRAP transporter small permease subunit [Dongiaceae bacterium]|jgi:TRAP-type C4-dicarboxylate transport system permease small subunit